MEEKKEKALAILNEMQELEVTIGDILSVSGDKVSTLLSLTPQQQKELQGLITDATEAVSTDSKGRSLEKLLTYLLSYNKCFFDIKTNKRTSTNEIDLVVNWSISAKHQNLNSAFSFIEDGMICECKNHSRTIGVTFIGKFISLVQASHQKVGVFFSLKGITGKTNWSDSKGLIRKLALAKDIYIIDLCVKDIEPVAKGEISFLKVINDKYEALKNDIKYENYICKHENENAL